MLFGYYFIAIIMALVAVGGGLNQEGELILALGALFSLGFSYAREGVWRMLRSPLAMVFVLLPAVQILPFPGVELLWWREFKELGNPLPDSLSKSPLRTLEFFVLYLSIAVLFFGLLEARRVVRQYMPLYVGLGVAIGAGGILAILGNRFGWSYAYQADSHVFSFFPNRNQHGFMFSVGVVLGVAVFVNYIKEKVSFALLGLLGSLASFGGLVYSISKGALVLAILGTTICLAIGGVGVSRKFKIVLGILGCGLACLIIMQYGERLGSRLSQAVDILASGDSFRVKIWGDALPLWGEVFFSGVSAGQFESNFWQYRDLSVNDKVVSHPENDYLWWFIEYGFAGFVLALAIGCRLGRGLLRGIRIERTESSVVGVAIVVMGLTHGLFDISMHIPATLLIILLFIGTSLKWRDERQVTTRCPNSLTIVFGGVLGAMAIIWSLGIVNKDYAFHSDEIRLDALAQEKREAIAEYDEELLVAKKLFPLDWELYVLWGHRLVRNSKMEEGDLAFESARYLDPFTYRPAFREGVAYLPVSARATMRSWAEALKRYPDHGDRYRVYGWMKREAKAFPGVRSELGALELVLEAQEE